MQYVWIEFDNKIRLHNITNEENIKKALRDDWLKIVSEFFQKFRNICSLSKYLRN